MSENLPAFDSLKAKLFPFMHDQVAGLHGQTAVESLSHLVRHSSLPAAMMKTVHVGAGFGGDMQEAYKQGVLQRIGLEKDKLQIDLASALATVTEDELVSFLEDDFLVKMLYSSTLIKRVAQRYCRERKQYDPELLDIRECDVRDEKSLGGALGEPLPQFAGMIGNIMLHWLVQGGYPLRTALDTLGLLLFKGDLAVFSIPMHFITLTDPDEDEDHRSKCLPDSEFYRLFTEKAVERLIQRYGKENVNTQNFRKVPSLLIRESQLREGSDLLELADFYGMWSNRTAPIDEVMAGFGTYESALRADKPAREIAPFVVEAIDYAARQVGTNESAGTRVFYCTFRKK